VCANLIAVGKVKGFIIHNFLIFFVTQFVVSLFHFKVTIPVGHNDVVHCRICVRKRVDGLRKLGERVWFRQVIGCDENGNERTCSIQGRELNE